MWPETQWSPRDGVAIAEGWPLEGVVGHQYKLLCERVQANVMLNWKQVLLVEVVVVLQLFGGDAF